MGRLQLISSLVGHKSRVWNVGWSPDGTLLTSCGEDKTVRVWGKEELGVWTQRAVLTESHDRTVRQSAWSKCGRFLASASFDATVAIWGRPRGGSPAAQLECVHTLEGHENEVKAVAWSPSGQYLASCGRDKSVMVWELTDEDDNEFECAAVLNEHTQDVKKVAWHPHLDILASASYDDLVKVYEEDDGDWTCVATLSGHDSTVWSLSWDITGRRLATVSDDLSLRIWRHYEPGNLQGIVGNGEGVTATEGGGAWKCVCILTGHHILPIYDVDWCKLTGLVATASGDDGIRVFKEEGVELGEDGPGEEFGEGIGEGPNPHDPTFTMVAEELKAHSQDVNSVAWNPKIPYLLASAGDDYLVKVWMYHP